LSKILALAVEQNPEWVLPTYRKWNKAKCLWKPRQSIVGLLEYTSKRNKVLPFNELVSFIHPLLQDKEYYVQKGIGWTLREIYNAYPVETLKYFNKNLLNIKSIAYSAATEKLDKKIKLEMNQKRKKSRGCT
jgi:3-methyladenine DNA glycosylase AlkD